MPVPCRRSGLARCRWRLRVIGRAGGWGATAWAPTTSTTSAIRGTAGANMPAISITSRRTWTGEPVIIRARIRSTSGGRNRRRILPSITKRVEGALRACLVILVAIAGGDAIEIVRQTIITISEAIERLAAILVAHLVGLRPRLIGTVTIGFGLAVDGLAHRTLLNPGTPPC